MRKNKILFVTGNFGVNDKFPRCKQFGKHDFIMFTDNAEKYKSSGWTLKEFSDDFNTNIRINNILRNRFVKFQLHHMIDVSQYTMIVYCDGYMFPIQSNIWSKYLQLLKRKGELIQQLHKLNIYDECTNIVRYKRDTEENMKKMLEYFQSLHVPKLKMYENTAFIYDPSNEKVRNVLDDFWKLYRSLDITYRDQPLWAYIMYKNNMNPHIVKKLFENFAKTKVNHKYE